MDKAAGRVTLLSSCFATRVAPFATGQRYQRVHRVRHAEVVWLDAAHTEAEVFARSYCGAVDPRRITLHNDQPEGQMCQRCVSLHEKHQARQMAVMERLEHEMERDLRQVRDQGRAEEIADRHLGVSGVEVVAR